jgi:hypothetical protein
MDLLIFGGVMVALFVIIIKLTLSQVRSNGRHNRRPNDGSDSGTIFLGGMDGGSSGSDQSGYAEYSGESSESGGCSDSSSGGDSGGGGDGGGGGGD